jgi:deoxyribonuclease-4
MLYLGCHVKMKSPAYLEGSVKEALSYKANALMVYTGAPQNSKRIPVENLKIEQARALMQKNGIEPERMIIHAPYIINLANSVNTETAGFGVEFLIQELERVEKIGAKYLVLHPGSHMKAGVETGIEWIIKGLNEALEKANSNTIIALETMAGKGSEVGSHFEELAAIKNGCIHQERIKVCLDTCHIHDAGYNVLDFNQVLEEFDSILGLENLAVLHINDSKNVQGAHKDRHENIGKGHIGLEALARVVHHPKLEGITKILETPYIDSKAPYGEEIELLRTYKF